MPRTVMRDVGDRLRAVLILGLVTVCALAVALVPDWESDLGAQTYEEFTSIGAEALRDAEAERKVLTNRLDESRKETHARKWGVFATFERNTIRRSPSDRGNGFDSETPGAFFGLDRRLSDSLLVGTAAGFKVTDLSFDDTPGLATLAGHGRQRTYTETFGPYLSYNPGRPWYLSASVLAGLLQVRTERSGAGNFLVGKARGFTSGSRFSVALGGGYDWPYRAFTVGPRLNVSYDRVSMERFSERGQRRDFSNLLAVPGNVEEVATVKVGSRATYARRFSWGTIVPNWRLDFVYRDFEQSGGSRVSPVSQPGLIEPVVADRPDPTSMEVGLGVQFALPKELTFWIDYEENFLERFLQRDRLTVGIRKQF